MANTPTPNRYLLEPALNDLNWNTPLNANFTSIDQILGSTFGISLTGVNLSGTPLALTSSTTPSGSVYWYSAARLNVTATGNLTANASITLPSSINSSGTMSGTWIVSNNLTSTQQGAYTLTIKGASGSGVTVAQGSSAFIYFDGTDVSYADNNITNSLTNPTFGNVIITGTASIAGVTTIGIPTPQTVTITIASPGQVTATSVPVANTPVVFTTTGSLPGGITAGTTYYVLNPTSTTFNISSAPGGSAINTSGTQSGVHTATFSSRFNDALNLSSSTKLSLNLPNIAETATISATAATGTVNFDVLNQSVLYYTTAATGNWTLNVRGDSLTSLNSIMDTGQALTVAFAVTNQTKSTQTATITIASPAVITTSSAPPNGTPVSFSTTGSLPTGITAGTLYYVINASGTTYNIATSISGTAINTSGTQSGTHTATYYGLLNNVFQVDGSTVTPKWLGGTAPTYGTNAGLDVYTYTIIKTASATYTALASFGSFK